MSLSVLLLLLLVCSAQASDFLGTVLTYYPKQTYGSLSVDFHYKQSFRSCLYNDTWYCPENNCGYAYTTMNRINMESSGEWCQTETFTTRVFPDNNPFLFVFDGSAWINNIQNVVAWRAVTWVELRTRSDTGRANTSPQTTVLPALRVPSNCPRDFSLLAFDPDGDEVKCRHASSSLAECTQCAPPSVLSLSSSCTLSFSPTNSSNEGPYAVQLVMEDFPRQNITLTRTNGSQEVKTTNNAISKIPVQFVLKVVPAVPTCTQGIYLPTFLPPTPANGARLNVTVTRWLDINIKAEANVSTITGLLVSEPHYIINASQNASGPAEFILTWAPSWDQAGKIQTICFVVQAVHNGSKYHSDLRCVTVSVEYEVTRPTVPPLPYLVALRVKISLLPKPQINYDDIWTQINDLLLKYGLSLNSNVQFVGYLQLQPPVGAT
ncbi:uncharacterized protein LOC114436848 [Parambassis ranga]|uniref:Uncharacterized protein LOC114436848 n=1 Tax=Parambassis ranga TaxID=210632 RepID=A0A6P7IJK5_9TELE|nr:uncharacterized protein LOC114436848 [Parambassis ranga]